MNPEQLQKFNEMYSWFQERKQQQLSYPVDDASKNALGAGVVTGLGSTALTQVYVDSNSDTVTAPKEYAGTVVIVANGVQYEVPYLAIL